MIDQLESLAQGISDAGIPAYLVVDGALVTNIRQVFRDSGYDLQTLFHDRAAKSLTLAGPWIGLLPKEQEKIFKALLLAKRCRCGIVWLGSFDLQEIRRHLTTLNIAKLPSGEIVYFRHYDADVLAAICPILNENQASRVLGEAIRVGFVVGRGAGATIDRPIHLPAPPAGPLAFTDEQIEYLDERQRALSRRKIATFLRNVIPLKLDGKTDEKLIEEVRMHEIDASRLHLDTERSITQWAHMSIRSDGMLNRSASVRDLILQDGPQLANENLDKHFYKIMFGFYKDYFE